MQLFRRYLRQQRRTIAAFAAFCLIFAVIFALYHIPAEAAVYPALLCGLLGAVLLVLDYARFRRRHEELSRICRLTAAMIGELPPAERQEDEDYQAVIRALKTEAAELETAAENRYQEMIDYYTIWAHQIKTPIASMRLQLQDEDTPEARRLLAELSRVEQYVGMALAFLRLDSASSDYVFRECDLDEIIRQSIRRFSHEFIGRRIQLQYEPVEGAIITDEKWLSFVLEQILSNALKYTREGSVRIYREEAPLTLCIEDTGIGIAREDLPRIFEKGFTGYNGRTDKRASGIGLYLCRRVCDNLGIGIRADSEIGKGTVIRLNLEQYRLGRE